jgi:Ca-activated chloride channel family protein
MRRSLLALLALLPATYATSSVAPGGSAEAAPSRAETPRGEVVYRPECFPQPRDREQAYKVPAGRSAGGSPTTTATPAAPPVYEEAEAEPSYGAAPTQDAGGARQRPAKKSKPGLSLGARKSANEMAPAAEPVAAPPPPPAELDVATGGDMYDDDAASIVTETLSKEERSRDADIGGKLDRRLLEDENQARAGAVLDWGAKIFLSNDDSMSLASAQRVLFSVMNGLGLSPSEIRPHELLNYFSFDTATPDADQLFDVLASAERDGDQLSLALAVKGGTPPRQALDLTLIVDRSCSMEDEGRMDYTRRGLTQMADQLHDGDRVDVVLFDDTLCVPLENYVEGRDDPELLAQTIASMEPEGATDLDLGLREGYRVAQSHLDTHQRNRRVMLITDALINTGDVNPDTVSEIGRAFDDDGIRLTGVGVGREFDDEVLDKLTEKGKGAYVYLGSEAVVDRVFGADGFRSMTETIAHDVQFSLQLPDSLAMERFYGEEASTNAADVQPINYYAGTSQLFLQDLALRGEPVRSDPVVLTVTYRDALTGEPEKRTFKTTVGTMLDADPHNVRKGLALMAWTDLLMAKSMGAGACGAELDAYARRAALLPEDAEIAFVNGLIERECGRLELPTVVSSRSVSYKVKVDADIPIAEVSLVCGGRQWSESLTGSDTVARFDAVPGQCEVTLSGQVAMTASVDVPETGGDLRCIVRGGRLSCS